MKKLFVHLALLVSVLTGTASAQTCGSTTNYTSEADFLWCNSSTVVKPANSVIDGTPSTADPLSRYQWNMRSLLEGQSYASLFSDAPADVIVAVLGTWPGHMNHPDLVNNYVTGINLIEGGTNASAATWDGLPPTASAQHDQCAAGIIAAEHNSIGMAGVFHRAKILPIRTSFSTLPAAINQAVAAGAKVIHLAGFAATGLQEEAWFPDSPAGSQRRAFDTLANRNAILPVMIAVRQALDAAEDAGVVVTNGVGNRGGLTQTNFFAAQRHVLAVGATNAHDEISLNNSMSYGYRIFAPGGDRREFAYFGVTGVLLPTYDANLDDPLCPIGSTMYGALTLGSAAAPHVAAAAAIARSYWPTATAEQIRRVLLASTRTTTPSMSPLQALGGLLSLKKLKANLVP